MATPLSPDNQGTSTRPYLVRALHDWCTDNGFTPYVAVFVDASVRVPQEYVKNNEIVLNIGFEATSGLKLGNDFIEFKARFGGAAREIVVPIDHVVAIYARENGQGMAFPVPSEVMSRGGAPGTVVSGPRVSADAAAGAATGEHSSGLRLARVDGAAPSPSAPPKSDGPTDTPPNPPGTQPPAPGRPSLKRVK